MSDKQQQQQQRRHHDNSEFESNNLTESILLASLLYIRTIVRKFRFVVAIACFLLFAALFYQLWPSYHVAKVPLSRGSQSKITSKYNTEHFSASTRPKGFKVVGLVFYGRPKYVNILDCYLKRNLIKNGGYLDEVQFVANTDKEDDKRWLDQLIQTEPLYSRKEKVGNYGDIWNTYAIDDATMYIKIDDDILFVDDNAIPRMVHSLLENPHAYIVAANLINSPLTSWLHYHTDAVLPYLPDPNPPGDPIQDWRASKLPSHPGREEPWNFTKPHPKGGFKIGDVGGPPFKDHRWLPMVPTSANLLTTPIAKGNQYQPHGLGWQEWTVGAQQHYSFLSRLETDELHKYWAGNADGIWNMQYTRYNLNFVAIWGSTVREKKVSADDEGDMTMRIPLELKKPCIVDTHAIVSHFSFFTMKPIGDTDLLERYRLYANEMVCTAENQKQSIKE